MVIREEIEKLKESWLHDPCWDIEDTEGFEEHREELLAFHAEWRAKLDEKVKVRKEARRALVKKQTGIDDIDLAQDLWTFTEIENQNNVNSAGSSDGSMQVRALLLVAAQLKRIADFLDRNDGEDGILCQVRDGNF